MIDSTVRSDGERGERAGRLAESVVERDAGRESEELGGDPGAQADEGARSVLFEAEAILQRPEHGLDALADAGQVQAVVGLVGARGAQDDRAEAFGDRLGELAAGVALVADDR